MGFRMRWPTKTKTTITQHFGEHPEIYKVFGLPGHEGLDFGAKAGTECVAVADGTVIRIDLDGNTNKQTKPYGNQVRIQVKASDGDFTVVYAHLTDVTVALGVQVKTGEVIAHTGSTGNSTGPHLHVTLKKAGATARKETTYINDIVNPEPFLDPFTTAEPVPSPVPEPQPQPVTPSPVPVPVHKPNSDSLRFDLDVTIPDNTVLRPGVKFVKTWRVTNTGLNAWGEGYTLTYFKDEPMRTARSIPLPPLRPGETGEITLELTAPTQPGACRTVWKARGNGQFFGMALFAIIKIQP